MRVLCVSVLSLMSLAWLSSCANGSKNLSHIDGALTEIQNGRVQEGRGALERLCDKRVSGACALINRAVDGQFPLPIMQSVTLSGLSRFAILAPKDQALSYYVRRPERAERLRVQRLDSSFSDQAIDHVEAFDLDVTHEYELLVIGQNGALWDRRKFKTLDLKKTKPRLAVVSCMDDSLANVGNSMWAQVLADKPDAIFMIGDNVYADRTRTGWAAADAEQLWTRYVETRQALSVFRANPLVPVFAVWDDHDYGRNDSDRTYPFKEASAAVFMSFFPQAKPAEGFARGPGVASLLNAFGVSFVFLDDRSFRSPNKTELPDETHFGAEQERWLQDHLNATKAPVVLISGDQFFGGYHTFESYEGSHPRSFSKRLAEWRKAKAPLVFFSGDRHLTEIIKVPRERLGYPTFEITSSGIHAKVFADAFQRSPNPRQLAGLAGQYNYTLIDVVLARPGLLQMDVQALGPERKLLYRKTLTVKR